MIQGLPTELEVNGREEPIRWECSAILDIIAAMNDSELEDTEKAYTGLWIFYENFEQFTTDDYEPAFEAMLGFMDHGIAELCEKDNDLLIQAINLVAGEKKRFSVDIHWWDFLGLLKEKDIF